VRVHLRAVAENQSSGTFVGFNKARGGNHEVSVSGESELHFADRVPICIFSSHLNVFCLRTRTKYRSHAHADVHAHAHAHVQYMKLAFCFVQSICFLRCWFAPPFSLSAIAFIPKGRGSEGRYHADSSCGYHYRSCGIVDQSCPLVKWICILPSPFLLCFVSVPGRHLLISGGRRLFPILV